MDQLCQRLSDAVHRVLDDRGSDGLGTVELDLLIRDRNGDLVAVVRIKRAEATPIDEDIAMYFDQTPMVGAKDLS